MTPEAKLHRCEETARALARLNPALAEKFRYNDSAVYALDGARVIMLWSWTITGHFLYCKPALDVTAYVSVDGLRRVEEEVPA